MRGMLVVGEEILRLWAAILRGMVSPAVTVIRELSVGRWGLTRARAVARQAEGSRSAVRALVTALFGAKVEERKRAADVARRITEVSAEPLRSFADELMGLLGEIAVEESRTRWHLGLVVARVAHTPEQRRRAGRLMELLAQDESNVVRCSAVEGFALLACDEPELRDAAEEVVMQALREGSEAERCRAREGRRRLDAAPKNM